MVSIMTVYSNLEWTFFATQTTQINNPFGAIDSVRAYNRNPRNNALAGYAVTTSMLGLIPSIVVDSDGVIIVSYR